MPVTRDEARYIAGLAHLRFSETELDEITKDLNSILEYMSKLNSLDTTGVEPLAHPLEISRAWREDTLHPSLPREKALKNAPAQDGEYFCVPKVIR